MKKILVTSIILAFGVILHSFANEDGAPLTKKVKYEIFASMTMNIKTNEIITPIVNENLSSYVENNMFVLNKDRQYRLYNRKEYTEGMSDIIRYDVIDNKGQRGVILFTTTANTDWATKNKIVISYEGSDIMYIYLSYDPQ